MKGTGNICKVIRLTAVPDRGLEVAVGLGHSLSLFDPHCREIWKAGSVNPQTLPFYLLDNNSFY